MKGVTWKIFHDDPGAKNLVLLAELSDNHIHESTVKKVAQIIANDRHASVLIKLGRSERGGATPNPTLVHHGLARGAHFHVLGSDNTPYADLYFRQGTLAHDVGELIANTLGVTVVVKRNILDSRGGSIHTRLATLRGKRRNPTSHPVVGEIWTDIRSLEKCRIVRVDRNRVTYLVISTGNRYTLELSEFLATHRGPRRPLPGVNPKGRKNPSRSKKARARRSEGKRVRWSRKVRRGRSSAQRIHAGLSHSRRMRERGFHGRTPNPKGLVFTHVDDMRPDVASRARAAGWAWRVDSATSGAWGKTKAEAQRTLREVEARARRRTPNPKGRKWFYVHPSEGHQSPVDRNTYSFRVGGWYYWNLKTGKPVGPFKTMGGRKARRSPNPRGRKKRVLGGGPRGHHSRRRRGRIGTRTIRMTGRVKSRRPRKARPRANPRSEKERARAQFLKWQDRDARGHFKKMKAPRRIPTHMAALGELVEVVYESNKYDGKKKLYKHRTKRPRPVLATDPDGRDVFVVGGHMKVTADGLVN